MFVFGRRGRRQSRMMPLDFSHSSPPTLPGAAESKWRIPKVVPRPHRRRTRRRTLAVVLTKAIKLFLLVSVCILLPLWTFSKFSSSDKSVIGRGDELGGGGHDIETSDEEDQKSLEKDIAEASGRTFYGRLAQKLHGSLFSDRQHDSNGTTADARLSTVALRNRRGKFAKSNKPVLNEDVHVPTDRVASGERPFLSKVSALTKDNEGDSVYERALRTHAAHNRIHGYSSHILRESVLESWWSKPAYLLDVLLQELKKPKQERLEWLFWHDADTLVLNPNVPLETFLPPPGWEDTHLLVTVDFNGLNNGIFLMRVSQRSLELLLAWLAFPHYNPDEPLEYGDQSAMAYCLQHPEFNNTVVKVPQRWFNSYNADSDDQEGVLHSDSVRPGDFMIHFAGDPEREEHITKWLGIIHEHRPDWEVALKHTSYPSEVPTFWEQKENERQEGVKRLESTKKEATKKMRGLEREMNKYNDSLMPDAKKDIKKAIESLESVLIASNTMDHEPSIEAAITKLDKAALPVYGFMKQYKKDIKAHAHDVLYDLDRKTLWFGGNTEETKEGRAVETALRVLKRLLLDEHAGAERIKSATEELNFRYQKFQKKRGAKDKKMKDAKDADSALRVAKEIEYQDKLEAEKEKVEKARRKKEREESKKKQQEQDEKEKAEDEAAEEAEREEQRSWREEQMMDKLEDEKEKKQFRAEAVQNGDDTLNTVASKLEDYGSVGGKKGLSSDEESYSHGRLKDNDTAYHKKPAKKVLESKNGHGAARGNNATSEEEDGQEKSRATKSSSEEGQEGRKKSGDTEKPTKSKGSSEVEREEAATSSVVKPKSTLGYALKTDDTHNRNISKAYYGKVTPMDRNNTRIKSVADRDNEDKYVVDATPDSDDESPV